MRVNFNFTGGRPSKAGERYVAINVKLQDQSVLCRLAKLTTVDAQVDMTNYCFAQVDMINYRLCSGWHDQLLCVSTSCACAVSRVQIDNDTFEHSGTPSLTN